MDSELASNGGKSNRIFSSSSDDLLGSVLAFRFFHSWLAQNFCAKFAGRTADRTGNGNHRSGDFPMQLKMWVLSSAALILWLAPLTGLDKNIRWHKSAQGLSLCAAIGCAIGAGNIARFLADEAEIEAIKTRAINADVIDEISTSTYISQQKRQQEAEAILASPVEDVEEVRQVLEAIYSGESEETEVTSLATTSEPTALEKSLYLEVCKSREVGKSSTWIIENILKMKGRKFAQGKEKLQALLNKFDGEGKR